MRTYKPLLLLSALVCTVLFLQTYGTAIRAQVANSECIGKIYGTPGCPIKQLSRSCGDGRVDPGEECDNGSGRNGDGNCSVTCQFLACGDGIVSQNLQEECEPTREEVYAVDPETGVLTTELRFTGAACGIGCSVPLCNEQGICSGGCKRTFKAACTASVASASSNQSLSSSASGTRVAASSSASSVAIARCGNGIRDPGEQCDDGNLLDTDNCTIACKLPRCGDGAIQRGEACDDGNSINTDRCTNRCTVARCGDGIMQLSEVCDDGERNSNLIADACRSDCSAPRCGDGVVDRGEQCDGGELCTADCVRLKSAAELITGTSVGGKTAILLSLAGGVLVLLFLFRAIVHRFVRRVAGEDVARSIDDIPLDEIEMPWHKW